MITIELCIIQRIGTGESVTDKIGSITGYWEDPRSNNPLRKFHIKEIYFKGKVGQGLLEEITQTFNIRKDVFSFLYKEGINLDPMNVDFKIDFGNNWPVCPVPLSRETRIAYEFRLLPQGINLKITRLNLTGRPPNLMLYLETHM